MNNTEIKVNQVWNIPARPIIRRCKYCKCILKESDGNNFYCSDWCKEMGDKQKITFHKCKYCNNGTSYWLNKYGRKTGGYRKICDECWKTKSYIKPKIKKEPKPKIKKEPKPRSEWKKREIDMNGHTCKKCGKYKTLDMFDKNSRTRKGINYRCKQCCAITHKMYVHRNREKINLYQKLYNRKKVLLNKDKIELQEMK